VVIVLPDHTKKLDVIPTIRAIRYLIINISKLGFISSTLAFNGCGDGHGMA
jgi:hypothetical protein